MQYVGIQASEKVSVSVDVIATGTSGHASVPRKDNPVAHLAAAIAKIAAYETPVQFNSVTRAYFEGLAPIEDEETAKWMRSLDTSDRGEHAARYISDANPIWNAMLRDTISPTMLQAGIRPQCDPFRSARRYQYPLAARQHGHRRFSPNCKQLVNDPAVRFEVQPNAGEAAPSSSLTIRLYNDHHRVRRNNSFPAPLRFRTCPPAPPIPIRCECAAFKLTA